MSTTRDGRGCVLVCHDDPKLRIWDVESDTEIWYGSSLAGWSPWRPIMSLVSSEPCMGSMMCGLHTCMSTNHCASRVNLYPQPAGVRGRDLIGSFGGRPIRLGHRSIFTPLLFSGMRAIYITVNCSCLHVSVTMATRGQWQCLLPCYASSP